MGRVNPDDDLAMVHAILDAQEVPPNASAAKRLVDFIDMIDKDIDRLTETAIKAMENIASTPRNLVEEAVSEGVKNIAMPDGSIQLALPLFEENP